MILIVVIIMLVYRVWRMLGSTDYQQDVIWLWTLASLAALGTSLGHALFLYLPANLWVFIPLALVAHPLTMLTQRVWAVAITALAVYIAAAIFGSKYTDWFNAKARLHHGPAHWPFYLDQRFNVLVLLLVFVVCMALAGVVLLLTLPALILLPVPPPAVPWLAPLLGLPLVLLASKLVPKSPVQRYAVALYLATAVLARIFRESLFGIYDDNAWELIWCSVMVPLCAAGTLISLVHAAARKPADDAFNP